MTVFFDGQAVELRPVVRQLTLNEMLAMNVELIECANPW